VALGLLCFLGMTALALFIGWLLAVIGAILA